jgi:UDP-glucose:O-linked fucose beta-1,3-glucosyltransferase
LELQSTTEEFRRLHQERQDLLSKWEGAIQTMKRRDDEIQQNQLEYQRLKDEIDAKRTTIDEKQRELEEQQETNDTLQLKIETGERSITRVKTEQMDAKQDLTSFQDELDMLKLTLNKGIFYLISKFMTTSVK